MEWMQQLMDRLLSKTDKQPAEPNVDAMSDEEWKAHRRMLLEKMNEEERQQKALEQMQRVRGPYE